MLLLIFLLEKIDGGKMTIRKRKDSAYIVQIESPSSDLEVYTFRYVQSIFGSVLESDCFPARLLYTMHMLFLRSLCTFTTPTLYAKEA